ncbi:ATP-binding cassette sub-family a member 9 [Fusarium flagelliforme]|uniref:ATP-binding cassette sub-family a member 9 n=1 Tax=Fusarium flagelliforme TaxID=2675880 RepID=A0A395MLN9_9HYPO|nr:ATP-binding cassette sub-family a member 9 [Fusarium flagelliforme]
MSKVGLTPYASRLTHVLSGGNKRKWSLAIALLGKQCFDFGPFELVIDKYAGNPRFLILDEPSSAMDAFAKREIRKMLFSITSGAVRLTGC